MRVICGKAGTGTTNELLKMFLKDTNTATFLSDEIGLDEIFDKINYLKEAEDIDIIDTKGKEIKTNMFANCDFDYYTMIQNISSQSIYINLRIPLDFKKQFREFCIGMEKEYGHSIVMTEQLNCNANVKGIKIVDSCES